MNYDQLMFQVLRFLAFVTGVAYLLDGWWNELSRVTLVHQLLLLLGFS